MCNDAIARAFELARSGAFSTTTNILRQLRAEGCPNATLHFNSPSLRKQLLAEMRRNDRNAVAAEGASSATEG